MPHSTDVPLKPGQTRLDFGLLGFAYVFIAFGLVGFATFGLHPQLLAAFPAAAGLYGPIYAKVGQVQVWLLWGVLAAALVRHVGVRWIPAFVAVYVLSFLAEFFGTGYGIPFGGYGYSALLGGKWFDRVPYVIPLSWFAMTVPAFALSRAFAFARTPVRRVLLASAILVAWDLALDPAMSHLTPYWIWSESGPYYGMPWLNLLGWYVTALVLTTTLAALRADRWIDRFDLRWMGAYYAVNLVMPVGMLAAAGMWLAVFTTLAAYALLALLALVGPRRTARLVPAAEGTA